MTPRLLSILLVYFSIFQSPAQGTLEPLHITFDGPPIVPPGAGIVFHQYIEGGMVFTPVTSPGSFIRQGGSYTGYPENGTAYVQAALGESLRFSFSNGLPFDLVSVDLADYSTVAGSSTVHFVGYRQDGKIVTSDLLTPGINFQTFFFDSRFRNLSRVEIPTFGWSLDNLVVSVPEPSVPTLLLCGSIALKFRSYRPFRSGVRTE